MLFKYFPGAFRMMKVLIALASLLALCAGQLTNLTNSQELDPAGNFRLSWEVLPESGDIVLEIQAKTAGWVSLEIVTDDGKYADVIFAGFNDETGSGYIEVTLRAFQYSQYHENIKFFTLVISVTFTYKSIWFSVGLEP
jgi:hypothetical protein